MDKYQLSKECGYKDVFISYNSNDENFAQLLFNALELKGIKTWFGPDAIKTAMSYPDEIVPAIVSCKLFVLIMSASSIGIDNETRGSMHVSREIEIAGENNCDIAGIKIDKTLDRNTVSLVLYMTKLSNDFDVTIFSTLKEKIEQSVIEIQSILNRDPRSTHINEVSINRQLKVLEEIESFLIDGNWVAAQPLLNDNKFGQMYTDKVKINKLFISFQKHKLIKNLPKHIVEKTYQELKEIIKFNNKEYGALCWFLIANLSKNYFVNNGLYDSTEGFIYAKQKYLKFPMLRISSKHRLMMNFIKDVNQF